jgi:YHS domain-containing protein
MYAALFAVPALLSAQGAMGAGQDAMKKDAMKDRKAMMAPHQMAHGAINTNADGVAIKGYDPVAYFTASAATPGSATYTASHQGALFRFASAANRDAFMAAPEKYTPQYGGYCAMGVAVGRKFDIDPAAFKVEDGKLYLNKDKAAQAVWLKDAPGNIRKANGKWSEVAQRKLDG